MVDTQVRTAVLTRILTVLTPVLLSLTSAGCSAAPNIVFVVADDLGWNDVGYHNRDIISPHIDALAKSGVILDQYYVQPLCSPSRSAFMTGYYPFHTGLQHLVIENTQAVCAPLDKLFLPELLRAHNFSTHMVGKWHLGFCKWECTPTYRGFQSFLGYYSADEDYYTKVYPDGFDFRMNKEVYREGVGTYSSFQFADRVDEIVMDHDPKNPLFLYLAFQNVHMPLEVPKNYTDLYPNITSKTRRSLSGMVTALDDAVGRLVSVLKRKNLYENTLIIFTSDNGGWTSYGGNNYPLRGGKLTIFEGGTRVVAFVSGPMVKTPGRKFDGLMHAVDWFPTIAEIAGINYTDPHQDGVSQWAAINGHVTPPRQEVVYNMDYHSMPVQGRAAIRVGDYKLIDGFPGLYEGWYKPDTVEQDGYPDTSTADLHHEDSPFFKFLFNLKDDPTEHHNLYYKLPEVARRLEQRLEEYKKTYVKPNFPGSDSRSNPANFNNTWSPGWC